MRQKKSVLREEIEKDSTTGSTMKIKRTVQFPAEPPYIKLYLDCLDVFSDCTELDKSLNSMLIKTLSYMSYADHKDQRQVINLNANIKKEIARATKKSLARYNQALTLWVKKGVLKRIDTGTYQVNPKIFGKGDWRDISNLRETWITPSDNNSESSPQ